MGKIMKARVLVAVAAGVVLPCIAAPEVSGAEKKQVFVNYDDTHFFYSRSSWEKIDETDVRQMVRQFRGSDVTDMLFCIAGRIACVTNGAKMSWLEKYDQKRENGRDVDYRENRVVKTAKRVQRDAGLDPYALWVDEAHACGIRAWLSFRVNDCHHATHEPVSFLHPDFFHDHPEYGRIRHRAATGYFDRCFDFAIEAVRERELKLIGEMAERYAADGLEVDWMREPTCFVPGRECTATMTEFMRRVRVIADRASKKHGRRMRVSARVPADPEMAFELGFDVAEWAEKGLVDCITPSPRWRSTDTAMPVALWKRLLRNTKTKLVPGIELLSAGSWKHPRLAPGVPQVVGNLHAFYDGGADGIYFFNYFDDPLYATKPYMKAPKDPSAVRPAAYHPYQMALMRVVGSPEKLAAADRIHMLTFEDMAPEWSEPYYPLPTEVREGQVKFFKVVTGSVPRGADVSVRFGIEGAGVAGARVFVNGRPCVFKGREKCEPALVKEPLFVYSVTGMVERAAVIEIIPAAGGATISYVDVKVTKR